ncbi:MAG: serine hydrolase domain-containing protein [Spirochaetia bacterium]
MPVIVVLVLVPLVLVAGIVIYLRPRAVVVRNGWNRERLRGPARARSRVTVMLLVLAAFAAGCDAGRDAGASAPKESTGPGSSVGALSQQLDDRVPRLMERYDIPGVSIAVVENREPAWAGAYGYADLAEERPMTTDAVCRAESISKSVTARAVLKLIEEGRIDPDAPVERYLESIDIPDGRFAAEGVTVSRLLSNTAGLPLGRVGPAVEYAPGSEMPSKRSYLAEEVRLVQEPGAGFIYSNVGFNLLELVVENVSGQGFESYMKEAVLEPLGMREASYAWEERLSGLMPTGYELDGTPVPPYVYPVNGSGGLFADTEDLARFVIATMEQQHTPLVEIPGLFGFAADAYGVGHFIETLPDGRRAVWHGGQGHGWMTHFHAIPETGDGIVILTNSQRSWPFMSSVLTDWARWSGAGRVKFGIIVWASRVLRAALALVVLGALARAYRLAREVIRRERRVAPLSPVARVSRAIQAGAGALVIGSLAWTVSQPYIFVSSIFPATAGPAGWSLLFAGIVLLAGSLLPRRLSGRAGV